MIEAKILKRCLGLIQTEFGESACESARNALVVGRIFRPDAVNIMSSSQDVPLFRSSATARELERIRAKRCLLETAAKVAPIQAAAFIDEIQVRKSKWLCT